MRGQQQQRIDYRHLIGSLVGKPGAFAQSRYRDELFASLLVPQAYDALCRSQPQRADRHYLRSLQLAATHSEVEVETALGLLLEDGTRACPEVVHTLVLACVRPLVPEVSSGVMDLSLYDQLLGAGRRYEPPIY